MSIDQWEQAKDLAADAVLSAPLPANVLRAKLIGLVRGDLTELVLLPDQPTATPVKIGARRVLVADDNRTNQRLACALLRKLGCDVDTADGGVEAVKKASVNDYGLVFMDCVMPDMDGFAATAAIRALAGKFGNVPVVALTASATNESRDRCFAVGMNDFLTKPIRSEQLSGCLVKWTESRVSELLRLTKDLRPGRGLCRNRRVLGGINLLNLVLPATAALPMRPPPMPTHDQPDHSSGHSSNRVTPNQSENPGPQ